ncbi:MAG: uroporphyrinogen-III C-methyltransferase [Pseudomonadota bacterium]
MNDNNKQLPATTAATPEARPARLWPLWLVILLLAAGLAGTSLLLWEQHRSQQNLSERLEALDETASELRRSQQSGSEARQQRLNRLETKLDEQTESLDTQSRQIAHNARSLLGLGQRTRTDWLLAEAEYLLRLANQRLELEGDHQGALRLLQSTDELLSETDAPGVHPIREALAEEILTLRTMDPVDRTGIHLQLEAAMGMIPELGGGERAEITPAQGDSGVLDPEADASLWQQLLGVLDRMVSIRRVDEPTQALLTPRQETQAQLHLQLMLEQAAAALLRGEEAVYRRSLGRADEWLTRWYDNSNRTASTLSDLITELRDTPVKVTPPDISDSLALLKARIRERTDESGPEQSSGDDGASSEAPSDDDGADDGESTQ